MIISLNPGGDESSFQKDRDRFESGDFSPSENPPYLKSGYIFARKVRTLLGNHAKLLEQETVAFPICFFRSKNWRKIPREKREMMMEFCLPYVREIIEKLQPKRMIMIGSDTYRTLDLFLNGFKIEESSRLVKVSKWRTIPIFATYHLSGFHFRKDDFEEMTQRFDHWFFQRQRLC